MTQLPDFRKNFLDDQGSQAQAWLIKHQQPRLAHHRSIPMKQLAEVSASDKALVSRTVKELIAKGLVLTASMKTGDRSLECHITAKGARVVNKVIGQARERHARLLLALDTEDRVRLYGILQKLQEVCADID
jgi:DNA-binding MarR family transcriptional regulator